MAYNANLAAGKYKAHALNAGTYETSGGALMLGVEWELETPEHDTINSYTCFISKAGVACEKQIAAVRKWAPGWDGVSLDWFGDHAGEFSAIVTIERRVDPYDNTEKPRVAFIDPVDGGAHGAIPTADQKALADKYGARLRALAGATPKPRTASRPQTQGAKASKPPAAQASSGVEKAKLAAWNAFLKTAAGDEARRNKDWFNLLARAVPGKAQEAFTVADWDAVGAAAGASAVDGFELAL
ncbi:MAG TPA: hypothetical protein DDY72_00280 [Verrucomicrobia bacterium]|nr:hypothetical protein [Verrucomicrobiota bacterium]